MNTISELVQIEVAPKRPQSKLDWLKARAHGRDVSLFEKAGVPVSGKAINMVEMIR